MSDAIDCVDCRTCRGTGFTLNVDSKLQTDTCITCGGTNHWRRFGENESVIRGSVVSVQIGYWHDRFKPSYTLTCKQLGIVHVGLYDCNSIEEARAKAKRVVLAAIEVMSYEVKTFAW